MDGKEKSLSFQAFSLYGGDKRDRTADLLNAIQALSQLSYTPIMVRATGLEPARFPAGS
jgi:hypothetical protein